MRSVLLHLSPHGARMSVSATRLREFFDWSQPVLMIPAWLCDSLTCRTGSGDELAELLWDNGPALRGAPPPFQPFTCSAGGSSRTHELKRHAAVAGLASVPRDARRRLPRP